MASLRTVLTIGLTLLFGIMTAGVALADGDNDNDINAEEAPVVEPGVEGDSVPFDEIGEDDDEATLAELAKEMQAKIEEQKDIINHKPRTSYFGRNGQRIKSHIAYKIRKYEKAAAEYSEQAAYHHVLAEQTKRKSIAIISNKKT